MSKVKIVMSNEEKEDVSRVGYLLTPLFSIQIHQYSGVNIVFYTDISFF